MQGVNDGDLLISGLQHFSFCRRQWALAYIEMQWDDNYLTVDGSLRHDRADDPEFTEKRGGLIVSRAIPVRSERYGIVGKCDVVEFRADPGGVPLAGRDGLWLPTPVEYKRGRPKEIDAYLYYMETKRREPVALSPELRNEVERMLTEMRALYDRGYTPKVKQTAKCRACSLADICLPRLQKCRSASAYTQDIWKDGEDNV